MHICAAVLCAIKHGVLSLWEGLPCSQRRVGVGVECAQLRLGVVRIPPDVLGHMVEPPSAQRRCLRRDGVVHGYGYQ